MRTIAIIVFLIVIGIVIYAFRHDKQEGFCGQHTRINCPTRNMSYDLRGEAAYPKRTIVPFMYSTIGPTNPRECTFRQPIL
jgi:hypothetical protein